jgi:protease PrsW
MKPRNKHRAVYIAVGVFTFCLAILLNVAVENPKFDNPFDEISFAQKTSNPRHAEELYLQEFAKDSLNLDLNYNLIANHFSIPEKEKQGKYDYLCRDDMNLIKRYQDWCTHNDSLVYNYGHYLLGLIYLWQDDDLKAKEHLLLVTNTEQKYLNNSLGNIYREADPERAKQYYRKEISLKGNIGGAVGNLFSLLLNRNELTQLDSIIAQPGVEPYLSLSQKKAYFFVGHHFIQYVETLYIRFIDTIETIGFIGALLVTLVWLFYLRMLDIFEREKWYHILVVFIISIVLADLSFLMYDTYNFSFHFDLNGHWFNDLMYCIFGIGLIEESIKLLPLLIFLRFSKAANEPIDYLIYASVAAIGFAFTENLMYIQNYGYQIIHGRALSAVVAHMCFSSIVAYGFIVSKYKTKVSAWVSVPIALLIAATAHGMYDFWLVNQAVKSFSIVSFVILVVSVLIWNGFKNNALNNSPFYDDTRKLEVNKISNYLFLSLSSIFLFEYLVITIKYGPDVGNDLFIKSIISGTFLMVFLVGRLAHFHIHKGTWESIWNWKQKD